jgi:very-short-patch-repair endonuclease
MSLASERLASLIEYVRQSARARTRVVFNVTDHGRFLLFEHQARAIAGLRFNPTGAEADDEIWLSVPRPSNPALPPQPESPWLAPWLGVGEAMPGAPRLAVAVEGAALIGAGTHRDMAEPASTLEAAATPAVFADDRIELETYAFRDEVERQYTAYLEEHWQPWADGERRRRVLSRLYMQLFTLLQEIESGVAEGQLELVWGFGLAVRKGGGKVMAYPIVTRQVDLGLDPETGAAEVRPRDTEPRLEFDALAAAGLEGVEEAGRRARELLAGAAVTLSPFDAESTRPFVEAAREWLRVPEAGAGEGKEALTVEGGWVVFARQRSTSVLIQDLEKFARLLEAAGDDAVLPAAVAALVTEPPAHPATPAPPCFRGVSTAAPAGGAPAQDLFFPKPYNDEQLRIVQLLEAHDGVVVQGPPGTGKTHTIANIICHWLATGRRVLVTSMKDPALAVLRDQLPEDIRPLAIALLASEQEGMRQFEQSVRRIASEVQSLDPAGTAADIAKLEETVEGLHARIAAIDVDLGRWARLNLSPVDVDGERVDPLDAAVEVASHAGQFDWIPDRLGVGPQYAPRFDEADVARLRAARAALGEDIAYAGSVLPDPAGLPQGPAIAEVHRDLIRFARLMHDARSASVPLLAHSGPDTLAEAHALAGLIDQVKALREQVAAAGRAWTAGVRVRIRTGVIAEAAALLGGLGAELEAAIAGRKAYLERPVEVPAGAELDAGVVQAAENLAEGKRAFGLAGMFFRAEAKTKLDAVLVNGAPPADDADWRHVAAYLALQRKWRELAARWNALAPELGVDAVPTKDARGIFDAVAQYEHFCRVQTLAECENHLVHHAVRLFPGWLPSRRVAEEPAALAELERVLGHYASTYRLGDVWAVRNRLQQAADGTGGSVGGWLRTFLAERLGNEAVDEGVLMAEWGTIAGELARLHALEDRLGVVAEVTGRIAASGAPVLAARLREQRATPEHDALLPQTLLRDWRLRRLAGHLEAIDARDDFRRLAALRTDLERDLARAYQALAVRRTWLKLAENATPRVRAALQAYLNAVQKIGKGTGKRAVRYRQDAREAAAEANHAVPCWIMPHYRVSETLPAEFGCFDLVIVDEASQSDLSALPALLRGRKLLIVGDDRQVSPEGVGLDEERVRAFMARHLCDQVPLYRAQMSPERSIYDLAKVVFAGSGVMLKEHFRCVAPIVEYSKREFYDHELRPLRLPRRSERLDPPLVDVYIEGGARVGDINPAEVQFIVTEIRRIVTDPAMRHRTVGVVSLLGEAQAAAVWDRLTEEFGPAALQRHAIACGDARTFQGRERDIMFLSMVCARDGLGAPLSRDIFAQRFNVAASRARDRMYLVRSVQPDDLSDADRLRRGLIEHFASPFAGQLPAAASPRDLCESPFERALYDWLTGRGYRVTPQVRAGTFRIDLVVEGEGDTRLAVECDGDKYQGLANWADDVRRQRALERAGWTFWRCFAATFVRRREAVLDELVATLAAHGITPTGAGPVSSRLTEHRRLAVRLATAAQAG